MIWLYCHPGTNALELLPERICSMFLITFFLWIKIFDADFLNFELDLIYMLIDNTLGLLFLEDNILTVSGVFKQFSLHGG